MKRWLLFLGICLPGCTQYAQVQMNLAAEARKGVAMCQTSHEAYVKAIDALHASQRARLDDAFDQDVRDQSALAPDWVVAHRKVYAAALEALASEQQQLHQASDADLRNLQSIDAALAKLYWLESIEANWTTILKETNP